MVVDFIEFEYGPADHFLSPNTYALNHARDSSVMVHYKLESGIVVSASSLE